MGQHWLENHDALFWINPLVMATKSHTLKKAQRIRNFRHTKGHDNNNNEDPFRRNNLQHWTRRGFLVPSSRQCAEPETTETQENISIRRNNTNGTEESEHAKQKHQPNRNHRRSQQILTTTPPAIDLHTPQQQTPFTS